MCTGGADIQRSDTLRPACADPRVRLSLHLYQMKSMIMSIISPHSSASLGSLPAVTYQRSCCLVFLHCLDHYTASLCCGSLRLSKQCNYCWRRVQTRPATTVNHSKPACSATITFMSSERLQ